MLTIISHSTFDLEKVLNMVLELAARLSEADKGVILRASGNRSYHAAASYQHTPELMESQKGMLFAPGRAVLLAEFCWMANPSKFQIFLMTQNSPIVSWQSAAASAQS